MSWYSKIYGFVREYRERHWLLGFFLYQLLNCMFVLQICGAVYFFYVYNFVFLQHWVTNDVQRTVYAVVYNFLIFMWSWSLAQTCVTRVARVPERYHVSDGVDKKIKDLTAFENGRYAPFSKSTAYQHLVLQRKILTDAAANLNLKFAEEDDWKRLRYCYDCKLIKPDRARHCMSCGFCVLKFDHHCPWINKSALTMSEGVVRYFINQQWRDEAGRFAQVLTSIVFLCCVGVYPLGKLLHDHIILIHVNETTCDQAKPSIIRDDLNASYNLGTYRNIRAVFGWGLWAIPLDTRVNDGQHFPVAYPANTSADRFVVRCASLLGAEANPSAKPLPI
ncbi:hypothetical protein QR680_004903 [Steinernema hermaphroditum]|uniref:Palmitoyltransferase n=1 Tax=Steinernema hermaphroditum TaxID=289476 RepID=A0AA39LUF4_9BILA|nr:hypothetical protein QR680_004903 [Steinernema hermaphroditum]